MDGIILAAGRGERLRPLTGWLPKFMVPLGGVPVVVHVMNRLLMQGCKRLVLVVSTEGAAFIQPLRMFLPKDLPLEIVLCDLPGQMQALRRGLSLTSTQGVWVAFCDNIFDPMKEIENKGNRPIFVSVEAPQLAASGRYGVVGDGSPRISKANMGTRVQTGLFYLPRSIGSNTRGEDLATIISEMPMVTEHVFASWWRDVGEWDMHLECEQLLREARAVYDKQKNGVQPAQEST